MQLLHFHFKNQTRLLKGTGGKRDVCPGSSVSTRVKFPVAQAESAPRWSTAVYKSCERQWREVRVWWNHLLVLCRRCCCAEACWQWRGRFRCTVGKALWADTALRGRPSSICLSLSCLFVCRQWYYELHCALSLAVQCIVIGPVWRIHV